MARKAKPKNDEARIGHNSGQITAENQIRLQGYVGEIEKIDRVIAIQKIEIGEIYKAAKDANFDTKALRALVRERRIEKSKRDAFEAVMDAYRHALGMLANTPLGQAALRAVASESRPTLLPVPPPLPA